MSFCPCVLHNLWYSFLNNTLQKGVETVFTKTLLVNFTNNFEEMANNNE